MASSTDGDSEIASLRKDISTANSKIADLRKDLSTANSKISALEKQISVLSNDGSISSRPVIVFDAYRNVKYKGAMTTITYDGLNVNEGGAMNKDTGIFKTPFNGIYEFSFYAISTRKVRVRLRVNGRDRAMTQKDFIHESGSPLATLSMSVILELVTNDKVSCFLEKGGPLYERDTQSMSTHFTGKLLALK